MGAILSLDRSPESVPLNNSHPLPVHWAFVGSSHISKYGRRSVACATLPQGRGIKLSRYVCMWLGYCINLYALKCKFYLLIMNVCLTVSKIEVCSSTNYNTFMNLIDYYENCRVNYFRLKPNSSIFEFEKFQICTNI